MRSTILGNGRITGEEGATADILMLQVLSHERRMPEEGAFTQTKTLTPANGSAAATSGTLSIDVTSVDFKEDGTVLAAKTVDTSVKSQKVYYVDIFAHQNGYFCWYPACDYWIAPNETPGYDTVPFMPLDATSPITFDFIPFDKQGRPVSQALQIELTP